MRRTLLFFVFVILLAAYVPSASARTTLTAEPLGLSADGLLGVRIRAEVTDAINAVGMTVGVAVPARIVRFNDDDSVVRLWVQRDITDGGELVLQGVIPGGVGPVFSDSVDIGTVWINTGDTETVSIVFRDVEIYLNQPNPSRDDVIAAPATLRLPAVSSATESPSRLLDADVRVVREADLNDGRRTLVYDIKTERGTVQSVRVRERWLGIFGVWRDAVSQSTLSDPLGVSILEVALRESDGGGRVAIVVPPALYAVWGVILLLILSIVMRFMKRH